MERPTKLEIEANENSIQVAEVKVYFYEVERVYVFLAAY